MVMKKRTRQAMAFLLATGMVAGFGGSTNIVVKAEENGDVTVNESGYPITNKEITVTVSGPKPSGLDDWTRWQILKSMQNALESVWTAISMKLTGKHS